MPTRRHIARVSWVAFSMISAVAVTGCGSMMSSTSNLITLSTTLRGANEIPANSSAGTGKVDALFNKDTNLLRWKVSYSGLTGAATAGHFHGPASMTANAGVVLGWTTAANGSEGSATLTPAQAADLLTGRWYANIHTLAYPGGEIRGQMLVRN